MLETNAWSEGMVAQVGVDLSKKGYLEPIAAASDDICVQLIFNNAGYMLSGFFESRYAGSIWEAKVPIIDCRCFPSESRASVACIWVCV